MRKTCNQCQTEFEIMNEDLQFYDKLSPVFENKKYPLPPPTLCPDCRQQRRLAQCNEQFLYEGQCRLCQKPTLTQYPPHSDQPYYCRTCWHSDQWDPRDYGQKFDDSKNFFEQFVETRKRTPAQALSIQGNTENSEYIHLAGFSKNSYLIMHSDHCEDCYYGYGMKHCTKCVDGFYNIYSELCYNCVDCHKCYGLVGSQDCVNCNSSSFLRDCVGCRNCFLCVGLRQKEYFFENKQLTQAEYEEKIQSLDLGSYEVYQSCKERLKELEKDHTFKEFQGHNLENCFGMHMYNCKDTTYSFDCDDVEHGKFLYQVVIGAKDVYDIYQYGNNFQVSYECSVSGLNCHGLRFCYETHMCADVFYSWYMENCKNCFGCSNMHHQSYCILNKQYSRQEYEQLVPKIIEQMKERREWGEFFPIATSPFGYNKTTAYMYYPLTREEIATIGGSWDEYEVPPPDTAKKIAAQDLPDNIKDIPDDILNYVIECEATKKLFRATKPELRFYRDQVLPFPRRSPHQRHIDRFQRRNPRQFWKRNCDKCQKEIQTTYSPDRPEVVYCEACYLETVY